MNFLGHLLLADAAGMDLAGAILGDIVRGRDLIALPPRVAESVRLHRRLDALTDRNPQVRALVAGFGPGARRYAPIILDVLIDHALALDWARYSGEDFDGFCQRCAAALAEAGDLFAAQGVARPRRGRFAALLVSYRTESGIDAALQRLAGRLRRPEPMIEASRGWPDRIQAVRQALPPIIEALRQAIDQDP